VDFVTVVDKVIARLRQQGRLTYSTRKRHFQLDEAALEDGKTNGSRANAWRSMSGATSWSGRVMHGLDPALHRMMDAVHQCEGTVHDVAGDGIIAMLGAPVTHDERINSNGLLAPPRRWRPPQHPHRPPHCAHGSSVPPRAPRSQAEHGAAWRWLGLDRRRRMGEGSAQGCPGVKAAREAGPTAGLTAV
jgi:hypothetical protein